MSSNGFVLQSGNLDKGVIEKSADEIVKILNATLEHRSEAVTLQALKSIQCVFDTSVSDVSISNVKVNMNSNIGNEDIEEEE